MIITDPIGELLGGWAADVNAESIILRFIISVVVGAIIGCERSSKRHAAGLRTFMLVSLAATMVTVIDVSIIEAGIASIPVLSAAAVIGMAIISSNSILFTSKNQIKGLTTSVGLWTCGILGMTAGAGLYTVTLIAFVVLLGSLSFFPKLETFLKNRSNHFEVHLELVNKSNLQDFVNVLRKLGLRIDDIESNPAYINSGLSVFTVSLTIISPELKKFKTHSEIIEALSTIEYVYHIEEMN